MGKKAHRKGFLRWRVALASVAILPAWGAFAVQDPSWQRIQRKYADALFVLTSSANLDQNLGSGFFITRRGQAAAVVPNLSNQQPLLVRRADGALVRVRVLKAQPALNLALIQVGSAVKTPCVLGDSSRARPNDPVGVMGYDKTGKLVIRPAVIARAQQTPSGVRLFRLTPAPSDLLPGAAVLNRKGEVVAITATPPSDLALPIGYLKQMSSQAPVAPSKQEEPPLWKELTPIIRAVRQISDLINRSEALAVLSVIAFQGRCTQQAQRLREEAVNTTSKLENEEERSFALSNVAVALARGGQIIVSLEVAKSISDSVIRTATLSQIARFAAQHKQIHDALHATDQLGDCAERCHALVTVALALHQSEPPNLSAPASTAPSEPAPVSPARELIQKAHDTAQQLTGFEQVVALAVVSAGWWSTGAIENAQSALDAAIRAAQSLDVVTREQALQEAAYRVAGYGLVAPVEQLLKHLPPERQSLPRAALVETLARQGELEAAQTHLAQLRDPRYRARATLMLAQQRLAQGDYETVSQLAASIPAGVERLQIESAWALALAQSGQLEEATLRLQQAEAAAQHLSDSRQIPEALGIVAACYLRRGDREKADALFEQAARRAQSLGEPWASTLLAQIWLRKAEAVATHLKQEPTTSPM
ncbi:MAG: hypothetical protein KatS3mg016_1513 [Fimbriimonadales bacterium]|nr:MAG: hypothetical protein KatS3mg016_1513 [Fimbriimonadales bacterium]